MNCAMESQAGNTSNQYLKTRVMTASKEQLQLMLYDGAIRFCEQGRVAIEAGNVEQSYKMLTKAENIIMELSTSMRDEYAPETCARMRGLYMFCYERLVEANMKRSLEPLADALKILRHIRETWLMLIDKLSGEKAGDTAAAAAADAAIAAQMDTAVYGSSAGDDTATVQVGATISVEG